VSALLSLPRSQLLVVDVQEKLAPAMADSEALATSVARLARIASLLSAPTTISEQYPKGLGGSLSDIASAASADVRVFPKMQFSCARDPRLLERILELDRPQVVICGIEAHVCVLQTAMDLKDRGLTPFVVVDAVSSRTRSSKQAALDRIGRAGIALVTLEMAAFEWLECAGTEQFKAVAPLLR
jgi:nicotinamidase-related amidase